MPLAAVLVLLTAMPLALFGQFCAPTVPTFTVDLTGNPDSVWLSPPTVRIDTCCGVTNPDRCVQFIVTLDTLAEGVVMDIPEGGGCGARPTGSLFYQVNCGPQVAIGTPVCLSGPGPHYITFCKPGNNDNCYQITSFPGPGTSGDAVATDGCNAILGTVGYVESSIQWRSIPSNPLWESYLSCTDSCDTTTASALIGAPPFVDYEVCGRPIGDCDTTPICDTLRVFFVSTLGVVIQPDSPTVCFGAGTTNITANVSGGAAPYTYVWTSGGVPAGGNSPVLAVGPGTYIVEVTDTLDCAIARDTVVVTEFSLPIQALAGNDFAVCVGDSIFLNGQVQAASGGIWSGGGGTFTPNASTLDAHYFPSPGETAAGFVNLTLTTTGNGTCPSDDDVVRVDIVPYPTPVISGPTPICQFTTASYSTTSVPGNTYLWAVTGGTIASGQGSSAITVNWAGAGAGSVTVTETNPTGCDSTVTLAIVIQPRPIPVLSGPTPVCQFDQATYSVPFTPGNTYVWAVIGGTILNGQNSTSLDVQWGAAGAGQVSVTETNVFGCDTTVLLAVTIQPKPVPVLSGPTSSCAWSPANYSVPAVPGHTYAWTVSGGSLLSGQGTSAVSVQWQAAGPGTISVLQTHPLGCDTTVSLAVNVLPNPIALISGPDSICAFSPAIPYSSPANAGATFVWTISGGSILSGQGSSNIQVAWAAAGSGSLTLLVTLPTGCDTTVSLPITILPKPTPVPAGPTIVCAFRPQAYSTPAVAGNTYAWTVAGGSITSGQGSNSINVQWAGAGSGSVTVTQTNTVGCDSSRTLAINIFPTPQPVLSGPATACEFTAGHVYSTPALPGHSYLWSVVGGGITGGQGSSSITVAWGAQGIGSVTLTQTAPVGSGACDTTLSIPVTIHPVPNPIITGPLSACEFTSGHAYSTPAAVGDSYLWTVSGGTITSGQGSPAITVSWLAQGAGSVTVQQTNGFGCDTTVQIAVTILPKPNPVLSGPTSSCAWSPANYSVPAVPGHTYAWSVSGGSLLSGQGTSAVSVQWQAAGPGSINIVQTDPSGCDTTVSLAVTVLPNPVALISGPDSICAFSPAIPYASPANAGATFVWTISGGSILSGQGSSNIQVAWAAAGSGSLTLLVTLPTGCDTTVSLPITILPKPTPVPAGPTIVCAFRPQAYSTPPVAGNTYVWTVAGGTILSGQGSNSINVQWAGAGSGSVTVTQTNTVGCDSTRSLAINIFPTPQPVLSGPVTACEFTAGHVYSSPALPGYGYLWSVIGGGITGGQGSNSITVAWGAQGIGSVTLTQTAPAASGGCDTTVTIPVTIHPVPNPIIAGPLSVCAFSNGNAYSTPAAPGDSYLWTVSGGTITSGQGSPAITVSWLAQGAGSVTLQQTNGFGCDTTVQVSVNILPQPAPVITGPTPVCAYQTSLTYTTPFSAGNSYFWTVTGGNITSGQGSASITVAWGGQPGTGTVTVTETHFLGCDSTVTLPVTLLPAPAPVINGSPFACAYSQSGYAGNADPAATITWSITGNGTIVPGTSPELITVAWGAPGPAVLTVHYAYASGCDSTVSLPVTIQSAPIPVMIGPDTVCQYSVHLYTTTAVPGVAYVWTPIGGTVISGQGTTNVEVSWSGFGNFSLELYAIAATGCDTTLSIPVHVLEGPLAIINPGDQTICQPGEVSFDGGASLGETGYQWTFGNGGTSTAPNPTSGFWVPGNYTIRLITTGPFACRDTAYATLQVQPGPYAEFTVLPGLEFIADIDTAAFLNFSTQPASYLWDFGDGLTDTVFEPQHYFAEPGDYLVTLLVTDSLGCTATYQQLLTVIWELNLFVPTAFTPNGDGLNDFFNVSHRNVLDFRFLIFSRWGELIYETRDKDFQWPGTYKSDPLQEGVYVWKLEATFLGGSEVVRSGTVTLIR